MASKWKLLVVCLLCILHAASAEVECQPDLEGYTFINYNTEVCFQFVYEEASRKSWSNAQQYCQNKGGRLINIKTIEEQRQLEKFMNLSENTYKPENYGAVNFDTFDDTTWGAYDPDVWIGASRDSDGVTWRFDTYTMSRNSRSSIVTWFPYGKDAVEVKRMENDQKRYLEDVCMFMRYGILQRNITRASFGDENATATTISEVSYPWYPHQYCEGGGLTEDGHEITHPVAHPFLCEYYTYDYREGTPGNWVYIIAVLGAFLACGFFACAMYCLWDKIHTSYNVLQV